MLATYKPTDIGELCVQRGWTRADLMREMRRVAGERGQGRKLPSDQNLSRMIRQWISGTRGLSDESAELLAVVFGVRFSTDRTAEPTRRTVLTAAAVVLASARQSTALIERLAATVDSLAIEQLGDDVARLSLDYLTMPPAVAAEEAKALRDGVVTALDRTRRPGQIQDLYLLAARLGGILSYAALDLGNARAAMANARSALICADLAGSTDLTAWVRGTQSLIARYATRFDDAESFIQKGLASKPTGTSLSRLASGLAQCRAHFGDAAGAREALNLAVTSHDTASTDRSALGLFGFGRSKVHFYAASSLIWLPDGAGAREAAMQATMAIKQFHASADELFVTDEVLAHIYGATAQVQLGQIDEAAGLLAPIFRTPEDQRVSWHRQRLSRIAVLLRSPRLRASKSALLLHSQITNF